MINGQINRLICFSPTGLHLTATLINETVGSGMPEVCVENGHNNGQFVHIQPVTVTL